MADVDRVYVLDAMANRVTALRTLDGSVEWMAGSHGGGPREFSKPATIALSPLSEILVADPLNDRIAVLDLNGNFRSLIRLSGLGYPVSMCPLADSTIVLTLLTSGPPVIRIDRSGRVLHRNKLPWPNLEDANPLPTQSLLAGLPDGSGCVLALSLGVGFARISDNQFNKPHSYVEHMDLPVSEQVTWNGRPMERLTKQQSAAKGVFAVGDSVVVPFGGESADAGRLEDVYDVNSGRYLYTHRLPFWSARTAIVGRRSYHLVTQDGYATIRAVERG